MIKVDADAKGKKVTVEGTGLVILNDLCNAIEAVFRSFASLGERPYEKAVELIEDALDEICSKVEEEYEFIDKPDDDKDDEEEEEEKPSLSSEQAELFFKLAKAIFEANHPEKKKEED